MVSSQETLRRLAIFDEGFVTAGSGHDLATTPALGPKTAALPQVGVPVAIGSSAVCLEWSAARAHPSGDRRGRGRGRGRERGRGSRKSLVIVEKSGEKARESCEFT